MIPNGFDLERFRPRNDAGERLRGGLDVASDAPLIGLVGRHHPVKGHAVFLRAARVLAREDPAPIFVLAGPGVDETNPELNDLAADSALSDRVRLLGPVTAVERLVAGLDIACCTSFAESMPNVVGEAMACEVPCVATDVGDTAELLGDAGMLEGKDTVHLQ